MPVFTQPDYKAWKSIEVGMTQDEVIEILGPPLRREDADDVIRELKRRGIKVAPSQRVSVWTFGKLDFAASVIPGDYEFSIVLQEGVVVRTRDPFGGDLSVEGAPSVPQPILPKNKSTFDHYPRFVDFRWQPSSGVYPVEYVVEVRFGYAGEAGPEDIVLDGIIFGKPKMIRAHIPHAVYSHIGMNPGIWRVKAKNRIGESGWSDFRRFEFTQ